MAVAELSRHTIPPPKHTINDVHQMCDSGAFNPTQIMMDYYEGHYAMGGRTDSTLLSRESLVSRFRPTARKLRDADFVLDIGSGYQEFEGMYLAGRDKNLDRKNNNKFRFITLDIVDPQRIQSDTLPAKYSSRVDHIRARGEMLPFHTGKFTAVVCNMGIELMEDSAIDEMSRVTKEGGTVHINVWNDRGKPVDNYHKPKQGHKNKAFWEKRKQFWDTFYENHTGSLLNTNEGKIRQELEARGFEIKAIQKNTDGSISWLEIDMEKRRRVSSGNGERQFGYGTRRYIISEEKDIHARRVAIQGMDEERMNLEEWVAKGVMTPEEMQARREQIVFHRKWISSEQTAARRELQPYKKVK